MGISVHPCHQPKYVEMSSVFLCICHKGISQRSEISAQTSSNFDLHLSLLVVQIVDSDLVRQGGPESVILNKLPLLAYELYLASKVLRI